MNPVTLPRIEKLFNAIEKSLFTTNPVFDYIKTIEAINLLARMIDAYDGDSDDLWAIGEFGHVSLNSLIVGAYWFCTDYHGGQNSPEYSCLSMLGDIFKPGMTAGCEPDSSEQTAYEALEILCPQSDRTEF